jgi:hypothetical protein
VTFIDQPVLERLRGEYLEMPGLNLTTEQVQRLCGIEPTICQRVLETLVEARFLRLRSDGTYARVTEGSLTLPRPAGAALKSMPFVAKSRCAS